MANYTYAPQATGPATGFQIFTDKGLSIPAALFDQNGIPLPTNQIFTNPDGTWPTFQSASTVLYFTDSDGVRTALTPSLAYGSGPFPVTGAKATALSTVVSNLMAQLVAAGIPIVDQTT